MRNPFRTVRPAGRGDNREISRWPKNADWPRDSQETRGKRVGPAAGVGRCRIAKDRLTARRLWAAFLAAAPFAPTLFSRPTWQSRRKMNSRDFYTKVEHFAWKPGRHDFLRFYAANRPGNYATRVFEMRFPTKRLVCVFCLLDTRALDVCKCSFALFNGTRLTLSAFYKRFLVSLRS